MEKTSTNLKLFLLFLSMAAFLGTGHAARISFQINENVHLSSCLFSNELLVRTARDDTPVHLHRHSDFDGWISFKSNDLRNLKMFAILKGASWFFLTAVNGRLALSEVPLSNDLTASLDDPRLFRFDKSANGRRDVLRHYQSSTFVTANARGRVALVESEEKALQFCPSF